MCSRERKVFAACRATGVGRSGDPAFCDNQAAMLLSRFLYHLKIALLRINYA